jgi:hypothetical protein
MKGFDPKQICAATLVFEVKKIFDGILSLFVIFKCWFVAL